MSVVVNSNEFLKRFQTLGWAAPAININELLSKALTSGIPANVIIKYLDALVTTPTALDDATIVGVTPAQGAQITSFLKGIFAVGT